MTNGLRFAIIAAAMSLGVATAAAQTTPAWPTKPIKAFIPFGAGSATDVVPRAVFDPLAMQLGQPIVIENRGGAGGTLGVGAVVRAEPDGYTILANSSAHTIAPWIVPNVPYDTAKDLAGALMIGQNANVLIVSPSQGLEDRPGPRRLRQGEARHHQLRLRRRRHRDTYERGALPAQRRH